MNTAKQKQQKAHQPDSYTPPPQRDFKSEPTDVEDVEIISEQPKKKGKTVKQCPECGKEHKNKHFCSNDCRIKALNNK